MTGYDHPRCFELIPCTAAELVYDRSKEIEGAVYRANGSDASAGYRTKMRSLYTNLKDKNNSGLRSSIISGELLPEKLIDMSPAVRLFSNVVAFGTTHG